MSKYKVGDKVILTVTSTNEMGCLPCYVLNDDLILSKQDIDKYTEPLSTYTEPLERKNENKQKQIEKLVDKLHRQAAEITRLRAENKKLKAENGNVIWNIEQAFDRGCNAAWELVRKIFDMETNDIEDIFITEDAWNLGTVLNNYTYSEAAAKVAEWENAKGEIKSGDVLEYIYDSNVKCVATNLYPSNMAYLVFEDGTAGMHELDDFKKTSRRIDIDSFLKQIGEE